MTEPTHSLFRRGEEQSGRLCPRYNLRNAGGHSAPALLVSGNEREARASPPRDAGHPHPALSRKGEGFWVRLIAIGSRRNDLRNAVHRRRRGARATGAALATLNPRPPPGNEKFIAAARASHITPYEFICKA